MTPFAYCEELCKTHDLPRWLGALYAPAEQRQALYFLCAFEWEIKQARRREAHFAALRLMWLSECLLGKRAGEASGHPVLIPLLALQESLPQLKSLLQAWLEAEIEATEGFTLDQEAARCAYPFLAACAVMDIPCETACLNAGFAFALANQKESSSALAYLDAAEAALTKRAAPAFVALAPLRLRLKLGHPASRWRQQLAIWLWARRR